MQEVRYARSEVCRKWVKVYLPYSVAAYWEKAQSVLLVLHLLDQHAGGLAAGGPPASGLCAPPRTARQHAGGKLTAQRAGELALVHGEDLQHLVVPGGDSQGAQSTRRAFGNKRDGWVKRLATH